MTTAAGLIGLVGIIGLVVISVVVIAYVTVVAVRERDGVLLTILLFGFMAIGGSIWWSVERWLL